MTLDDFLKTNGLTRTEFGERIGTTTATVSRIADGLVVPRRALLVAIYNESKGLVTPNDITGLHHLPGQTDEKASIR